MGLADLIIIMNLHSLYNIRIFIKSAYVIANNIPIYIDLFFGTYLNQNCYKIQVITKSYNFLVRRRRIGSTIESRCIF